MKLVEGYKGAWKWFSVQFPLVNTAFLSTWALLPEKFQNALPITAVIVIAVVLIVAGVAGRLIHQDKPKDPQ